VPFSLQGFLFFKSVQDISGANIVEHICGVTSFERTFWFLLLSTIAVLALAVFLYGHITTIVGNLVSAVLWAILVLLTPFVLLLACGSTAH